MIPPTIPAFVIAGPAKTGTTSLAFGIDEYDDFIYQGIENHEWTRCDIHHQNWQKSNWIKFLHQFNNSIYDNSSEFEYSSIAVTLVKDYDPNAQYSPYDRSDKNNIATNTHKNKNNNKNKNKKSHGHGHRRMLNRKPLHDCSVPRFYHKWLNPNLYSKHQTKHNTCIHPKDLSIDDIKNDKSQLPVCWFVEKAPSYTRRAHIVAPVFANILPQIKVLMLARDPLHQVLSYVSKQYTQQIEKFHRFTKSGLLFLFFFLLLCN